MNWDQKALEAWLEESARKDEDALTLQKYTRSDEGKVKVIHYHIITTFMFSYGTFYFVLPWLNLWVKESYKITITINKIVHHYFIYGNMVVSVTDTGLQALPRIIRLYACVSHVTQSSSSFHQPGMQIIWTILRRNTDMG